MARTPRLHLVRPDDPPAGLFSQIVVSDAVERILNFIGGLSNEERGALFVLLKQHYRLQLADDRQKFHRPWLDPAAGFGPIQQRLLIALDDRGPIPEGKVMQLLWPSERAPTGKRARARLRQLLRAVRRRLAALRYHWQVSRPEPGYLELTIKSPHAHVAA